MQTKVHDLFTQQQRQRNFNCFYPSQMLESPMRADLANAHMLSVSPAKPAFFLMTSQEERDAKLRRGIENLARFYPSLTEQQLNEALQQCNLDIP